MDRPSKWALAMSGLTLLTAAGGCRSTHSKIPPEPRLAAGGAPQAQFSSDPPPATGPVGMSTVSPGINGMGLPGQAPGGSRGDVPVSGLGTPANQPQASTSAPAGDPPPVNSGMPPQFGGMSGDPAAGASGNRIAPPGAQ